MIPEMVAEVQRVHPWNLQQVLASYPQRKQRMYREQLSTLSVSPLAGRDWFIQAFVKSERVENPLEKDPRMIQARSPRFNLVFGKFTKPAEKLLYKISDGLETPICKGLNHRDRARKLWKAWRSLQNPVGVSADAKRWDQHCKVGLLKVMHELFEKLLLLTPAELRLLRFLFSKQLTTKGRTEGGIYYTNKGGVCSGDQTTGGGNCAMVLILLRLVRALLAGRDLGKLSREYAKHLVTKGLKQRVIKRWYSMLDGDDFNVMAEKEDIDLLIETVNWVFTLAGHELALEKRVTDVQQLEFCQTKLLVHHDTVEMMPNPRKVLASALSFGGKRDRDYLKVLWEMRAIINQGQPILGPLFLRLHESMKLADKKKAKNLSEVALRNLWFQQKFDRRSKVFWRTVEPDARIQCEKMWGIPIETQLALEGMKLEPEYWENPTSVPQWEDFLPPEVFYLDAV
jgi:hypothetical protein